MRNALYLSFILLAAIPALAGGTQIINASCENAITKAEMLAAQRKWWTDRPDPKAPVLNIRSHGNFAKQALLPLGKVVSDIGTPSCLLASEAASFWHEPT